MSEELKQLQKDEALNRLRILQMKYGLLENVIKEFQAEDTIYYSKYINKNLQGILYWITNEEEYVNAIKEFEEKNQAKVYHAILCPMEYGRILSVLYVSQHQDEWKMDRDDLNDGIPLAYCINLDDDTTSEFGTIQITKANGGISRIA